MGKTYAANYLVRQKGYEKASFADKLKQVAGQIFPFNSRHMLPANKEKKCEFGDFSPREFHVKLGEFIRYWDKDYFIKNLSLPMEEKVVIDDVRLKQEADYLRTLGAIIVRVERPKEDNPYEETTDTSEVDLDDYEFDYTIERWDNTTRTKLEQSVTRIEEEISDSSTEKGQL